MVVRWRPSGYISSAVVGSVDRCLFFEDPDSPIAPALGTILHVE